MSIIISAKEVILNHDFTYVLEYLQDIREHIQIGEVIAIANGLYVEFKEQDFKGQARVTKGVLERREKKREKYERGR